MAQTLFFEKENKRLSTPKDARFSWPYLEQLIALKCLPTIDYLLAEQFLRRCQTPTQEMAAFICHLSLASKAGHLCIKIEEEKVFPTPQQLWLENGEIGAPLPTVEELNYLEGLIVKGAKQLPNTIVAQVTKDQLLTPYFPLCEQEGYYYLQRNWFYESQFLRHWLRINETSPSLLLDQSLVDKQTQELLAQQRLLPEQANAVLLAAKNSLTLITGGPGTGKTYTAGQLIRVIANAMSEEERQNCQIALAAPTGKAAANLHNSLKSSLGDISFNNIAATTLHALLGIGKHEPQNLSADIILVDESSMIDVKVMAQLFASIKSGARLILLGDKHQLPPVEAGSLFVDLLSHHDKIVELKTCMRTELSSILSCAEAINQGDSENFLHLLEKSTEVRRLRFESPEDNVKALHQQLLKHLEEAFKVSTELVEVPEQLLSAFNRFRLLSPLRQGPYGVEEINRLFLKNALKHSTGSRFIAPIMIVRNNPSQGLFNGEVGVLVCQPKGPESHFQVGDYAIFSGTEGIRKISALLLPRFEYAYCLSVHKSQGSEFDHVLVLNPEGSQFFGRKVLYTAVTRARKSLEIWGSDQELINTIANNGQRLSGIAHRL